jgi:histidyl-tRNA synthetase
MALGPLRALRLSLMTASTAIRASSAASAGLRAPAREGEGTRIVASSPARARRPIGVLSAAASAAAASTAPRRTLIGVRASASSTSAAAPPANSGSGDGKPPASASGGRRVGSVLADGDKAKGSDADADAPSSSSSSSSSSPATSSPSQLIDTNPPRGTRDFFPEDMRLRNWLFGRWADVARRFGFEQFDAPVLESEALFVRKAGEEITEQLYGFEDKGGRRVALRPEVTPSLARLVLQKGKALPLPAKWWAVAQCWRYERTTRGRRREHYQWNMDIVGVPGVEAEAELLAAMATFFGDVGLTPRDVGIKVSSRRVLSAVLRANGVPHEVFARACVAVDKADKLPREQVVAELAALGVSGEAAGGVLDATRCGSLDALEALLLGKLQAGGGGGGDGGDGGEQAAAIKDAVGDLRRLFDLAEAYGVADWLVFDASVVRGLAYYTGVVFEAFDRAGQLRAIAGGGRYDRLLSAFGGQDAPCAGFGFGDAVIVELLRDKGLLPDVSRASVDDVVFALDEARRPEACACAARLRAGGRSVDLVLEPGKRLKAALKAAERLGAGRVVLVGGKEWDERGCVVVRDMAARTQEEVRPEDLR